IADTKGNAVYANQAVTRIFGRRMSQVIGNPAFPLLFPSHAQELAVRDTLAAEGNYKGESSHQIAGEKLVTEVAMTVLDNPLADYASYIVIVRDITLRKKYEQELNESVQQLQTLVQTGAASLQRQITATNDTQTRLDHSLTESAWLVQEIHRRVRSNIQLIAGLLAMQLNKLPDPVLAAAFARSRQRIQSIAMVHEHLYESGNPVDVNFSQYAEALAANLCKEHSRLTLTVSVAMHVSAPRMRLDQAVPCGLIVAELVTNSLVHGFSGKIGRATVEITLERQGAQLLLRVRDDGKGLPQDFKLESDNATGMELVTAMTEQLGGELRFIGATGAGFEIAFPANPAE
ncbi:MAG: histidine kinase dimerization/phosphoacceptor domain -containing protein, partial [Pseudomonadales bacterium]